MGRSKKGRLFLRSVVILLALLVALDLGVRAGLDTLVLGDQQQMRLGVPATRLALYNRAQVPVDVILLGDSRVLNDLNPVVLRREVQDAFGRPANILNLGLPAGTPQTNYWLLKNVIRPDKQPRLLIYGAAELEFNPNGPVGPSQYADELATMGDYGQAFPDVTQQIDQQLAFLTGRLWALVRYRQPLHDAVLDQLYSSQIEAGSVTPAEEAAGYFPSDHKLDAQAIETMRTLYTGPGGYLQDYTVGGYQATRFEQLLQLARARGISVAVLNMPITRIHEAFLPAATYAGYRAYLRDTAARYNASFFDYNDHSLWDEANDFADTNHLNRTGATKLSAQVGQEVVVPALHALGWK